MASRGKPEIILSHLLWEMQLSDQETRCLKQTKNTLPSKWKSLHDNVKKVINSRMGVGGAEEKK